jgi:hypothetical protein
MDVILDSNAYLSDIRMESIKFKNLFDYLRRTKSSLVLPRLVQEEMIAKYRRLLDVQAKKTGQAIDQLNRLIFEKTSQIHYSAPKSAFAARRVRQNFGALERAGVVRCYAETGGVDVNEVFLRGAKRKRPASDEGEELRDVIIWLIALQYAQAEKKRVAFVTADRGFWKDTEIHDHLKQDIEERKVELCLFRSLEDFIKSSTPEPISVDNEFVSKFFEVTSMSDQIMAALKKGLSSSKRLFWQSFSVHSFDSISLSFSSGTVYEIDAETKFAELTYDVEVPVEIAFIQQANSSSFESILGASSISLGTLFGGPVPSTLERRGLQLGRSLFAAKWEPEGTTRVVKSYVISAKAQVSIRLVKGTLAEKEVGHVELIKADEVVAAAKASSPTEPPATT